MLLSPDAQVFQTASERVEGAGLAALTALTSCLSRSILSSDSEDSLNTFLDVVLKGILSIKRVELSMLNFQVISNLSTLLLLNPFYMLFSL